MRSRRAPIYDAALTLRVALAFEESFSWSLYALKQRLALPDYTSLIQLIDGHRVFCDLNNELLSEPEGCFVAGSEALVSEAAQIRSLHKIYRDHLTAPVPISTFPSQRYASD